MIYKFNFSFDLLCDRVLQVNRRKRISNISEVLREKAVGESLDGRNAKLSLRVLNQQRIPALKEN